MMRKKHDLCLAKITRLQVILNKGGNLGRKLFRAKVEQCGGGGAGGGLSKWDALF